jgi:predicted amidohydrolase YtcJ
MDHQHSVAQSVAIAQGEIVYVGTNSGLQNYITNKTRTIDVHGDTVLPGFIDSHIHLVTGGMLLEQCNLHDLNSARSILRQIADCARKHPGNGWVTGSGWDLAVFPLGAPDKKLLDAILPDRPAFFEAIDGHSAWVNSVALRRAGIGRDTANPPRGYIVRDASGEPEGTLREAGIHLVSRIIPDPTPAEYLNGYVAASRLANRYGITSIVEANATPEILETYAAAERNGQLTVRVVAAQHFDRAKGLAQIKDMVAARERWHSDWFSCNQVKLFIDGVLESHTASLLERYFGSEERGEPLYSADELNTVVTALDANGFQVHMHVIGDRAVRMALDAIAEAEKANGFRDRRHHLAHLELVDPTDIPRFGQLGVLANFQSLWAYPDEDITKLTFPALGPERSLRLYPTKDLVSDGATIVGGSDWSVTSMNPLDAIQVAITRRGLDGSGPALNPNEAVDLPTILAAYTINGAYLRHQENLIGSIEVGKKADIVVLEGNLFRTPVRNIHELKVHMTLVEGKEVYSPSTAKKLRFGRLSDSTGR